MKDLSRLYNSNVVSINNLEYENSKFEHLREQEASYLYTWKFGYYDDSSWGYTKIPTFHPQPTHNEIGRHTHTIDPIYFLDSGHTWKWQIKTYWR